MRAWEHERGTSLAIYRFVLRLAIPAQTPPTNSNQLTPTDSDRSIYTDSENRNAEVQRCRNAEVQKYRNAEMHIYENLPTPCERQLNIANIGESLRTSTKMQKGRKTEAETWTIQEMQQNMHVWNANIYKSTVVCSAEAANIDRKSVENLYIMNNLLNANVAIPHYIPPSFLRSPPPTPLKIRT